MFFKSEQKFFNSLIDSIEKIKLLQEIFFKKFAVCDFDNKIKDKLVDDCKKVIDELDECTEIIYNGAFLPVFRPDYIDLVNYYINLIENINCLINIISKCKNDDLKIFSLINWNETGNNIDLFYEMTKGLSQDNTKFKMYYKHGIEKTRTIKNKLINFLENNSENNNIFFVFNYSMNYLNNLENIFKCYFKIVVKYP